MIEEQAVEVISRAFTVGMPIAAPGVPFAIENEAFTLPDAGSFALLQIIWTTTDLLTSGTVGTRMERRNGVIQVKLWTPAGERTAGTYALAGAVRSIYNRTNIASPVTGDNPVVTMSMATVSIGNDGRWVTTLARTQCWYLAMV